MTLLGLLVGKALVWSIALGSGTSGGVLAPLLIMGGALGALRRAMAAARGTPGLGDGRHGGHHGRHDALAAYGHGFPARTDARPERAAGADDRFRRARLGVTVLLLRRSILTEKIARRGHHITREYSVDFFNLLRVGEVMDTNAPTISAGVAVSEFSRRLADGDVRLTRRQGTLIVDDEGLLAGIITRGDVVRALAGNASAGKTVLAAGKAEPRGDASGRVAARRDRQDVGTRHRPAARGGSARAAADRRDTLDGRM